jgi:hypothetical protein
MVMSIGRDRLNCNTFASSMFILGGSSAFILQYWYEQIVLRLAIISPRPTSLFHVALIDDRILLLSYLHSNIALLSWPVRADDDDLKYSVSFFLTVDQSIRPEVQGLYGELAGYTGMSTI